MEKKHILSIDYPTLQKWWGSHGQGLGPEKIMMREFVGKGKLPQESVQIASEHFRRVIDTYSWDLPKIVERRESSDTTIKYLIEFSDGKRVESVAVPFNKKYTLCLSTQVGCGMKCSFCFTGEQGLSRNLLPQEITGQYIVVWLDLKKTKKHKVTPNIVFMGQGEPLHNFDHLKTAILGLTSIPGLALGPKQITVSTVGYLPGLSRWEELPAINLAISLHSPYELERSELIPMNNAFSISKLFALLESFSWGRRKLINFEYLLIKDKNDSKEHAYALAELTSQFPCMVNIIPFNPYPGSLYQRPPEAKVEEFKAWLVEKKVRAMVRVTKGDEILAACGQLANQF